MIMPNTVKILKELMFLMYLLQFLLFGLVLLSSRFVSSILHSFDIRAQIFTDSLCEDEMQHQVVNLRL